MGSASSELLTLSNKTSNSDMLSMPHSCLDHVSKNHNERNCKNKSQNINALSCKKKRRSRFSILNYRPITEFLDKEHDEDNIINPLSTHKKYEIYKTSSKIKNSVAVQKEPINCTLMPKETPFLDNIKPLMTERNTSYEQVEKPQNIDMMKTDNLKKSNAETIEFEISISKNERGKDTLKFLSKIEPNSAENKNLVIKKPTWRRPSIFASNCSAQLNFNKIRQFHSWNMVRTPQPISFVNINDKVHKRKLSQFSKPREQSITPPADENSLEEIFPNLGLIKTSNPSPTNELKLRHHTCSIDLKANRKNSILLTHSKETNKDSVCYALKSKLKNEALKKALKKKTIDSAAERKRIWKGEKGCFNKKLLANWHNHMGNK